MKMAFPVTAARRGRKDEHEQVVIEGPIRDRDPHRADIDGAALVTDFALDVPHAC